MSGTYDDYTLSLILKAYLIEGKSHREIQRSILNLPAPANGGGFVTMEILHSYGIRGQHKSAFTGGVFQTHEFSGNAIALLKELLEAEKEAEEVLENNLNPNNKKTDQDRIIKTRVFQNKLRSKVLANYRYECALCNINKADLLICSHIVPWSFDEATRLDLANAISLCVMHDKLFDLGYFYINENYQVVLSDRIDDNLREYFQNQTMKLPLKFPPDYRYLELHKNEIFKQ